jgi:hypothetical protein
MVTRLRRAAIEHLSDMKKKFGLTTEQYVSLYRDAVCAVCGSTTSLVAGQVSRLVIDHDHKRGAGTDSIRGILCHSCNLAIGMAEDNPALLRALADYVERYEREGGPFGDTR